MLEFYSIKDELSTPEYPEEHSEGFQLIGFLSLEEHRLILNVFENSEMNMPFSFSEETRPNSDEIKRIKLAHVSLKKKPMKESERKSLAKYLEVIMSAEKLGCGLMTFCD